MTIDWLAFVTVVVVALVGACGIVALFSLGLRVGDSDVTWRRVIAVALYVLCGAIVLFGIWLIVPFFH
jgi:hypothetical protein